MAYKVIEGGSITSPKGFLAGACYVGVKSRKSEKPDVTILYSQEPATCAALFTTNKFCAAPVLLGREVLKKGKARAVVINSGNANAATGEQGLENAKKVELLAEELLGLGPDEVFVSSTGVIGQQLPVDKVLEGVRRIVPTLNVEQGTDAAWAIMTTDTKKKEVAYELELSGGTIRIAAMCKGSGMIHPNMCTMLSFVTTDAAISQELLQKALSADVQDTYNMVSVDGDTSTNDTVLVLANGLAGNPEITAEGEDYDAFREALHTVNEYLAKQIAGDGEGATALFEAQVVGAESREQAKTLSKSIVCSNLTKAAICGHDANWGRILCAMGYSGAQFDPEKVDLFFESAAGRIQIIADGVAVDYSEEEATKILSEKEVKAIADIKQGEASATAWGCDLTHDYIRINADYRS